MILLTALWFFLPAGLANTAPVLANKIPLLNRWNTPLDFDKKHRGKPIFGPNKTWRGLLAGMVLASIVLGLQVYLYKHYAWAMDISWFDYETTNIWLLGPLFGAGALLGDAIESFFKRQYGIAPGRRWIPFDQIDYIIGGLIFVSPLTDLSLTLIVSVFLVYFVLHLLSVYVGFQLGIRKQPI